jgi:small subunit ribosomal protein S9
MADKETTKKPAAKRTPRAAAPKKRALAKHAAPKAEKPVAAKEVKEAAAETAPVAKVKPSHPGKTFYAVGKRKTAVAQILLSEGNGTITVNKLPFEQYFQTYDLQSIPLMPLVSVGLEKGMNVKAKIHSGGIHAQAEALRHAISRALTEYNPESRRQLKKQGFLTRDPRVKERKKPGLKRARRAPQFSKR